MRSRTVAIAIVLIALVLIPAVSAAGTGTNVIINKKLVQSEYGWLGDLLGIGDRVYDVTYANSVTQTVFERTTLFKGLSKATIIETAGTQWQTAGQPVSVNFRVKGVNLPLFCAPGCTTTTHRFELDDITYDYRNILTSAPGQYLLNPLSYQNKVTLTIPAQGAGKRTFLVKEYVQATDGRWIPGAESLSSDMTFDVDWTQAVQAGAATPAATPSQTIAPPNPNYTPPAPGKDIVVDSVPSGATLQFGGGTAGNTPVQLTLFQTDGTKTIIVTMPGYKTAISTISYNSQSPVTVNLEPNLPPAGNNQAQGTPTASATASSTTPPPNQGQGNSGASDNTGSSGGSGNQGDNTGTIAAIVVGVLVLTAIAIFLMPKKSTKTKRGK